MVRDHLPGARSLGAEASSSATSSNESGHETTRLYCGGGFRSALVAGESQKMATTTSNRWTAGEGLAGSGLPIARDYRPLQISPKNLVGRKNSTFTVLINSECLPVWTTPSGLSSPR